MYVFGDFELDTERFQLRRGKDVVPLEPKVFDVLRYLVEHHDRVATKRELLDALWPGETVTEAVLPTNINALRRALGQKKGQKQPIETIHGRGYRFSAEVRREMATRRRSRPPPAPRPEPLPSDSVQVALHDAEREPFVGRLDELRRMGRSLERALAGQGQLCLLTGEAGIGKTRTAYELASLAAGRGVQVWFAQCFEDAGAPPFWPWVQLLRAALRGAPGQQVRKWAGRALPELVHLCPELGSVGEQSIDAAAMADDQARFRLFDAVTGFFSRAAQDAPRVLVIDDLQWADEPSLRLLRFVASHMDRTPILLLGTVRDDALAKDAPARPHLDALSRQRGCRNHALSGLSENEVALYVSSLLGGPVSPNLSRAVFDKTGGNPFFVRESLRLLETRGQLDVSGETTLPVLQLPEVAKDTVRRRLELLSEETLRTLQCAAVIGNQFELPVLEPVRGVPGRALIAQLDEAEKENLVVSTREGVSRYVFRHGLVRDTLYEDLPSVERLRIHAAVGSALETRRGSSGPEIYNELAYHFYQALPESESERAVDYLCRAARLSESVYAHEDSVRLYRRAIDAMAFQGQPDPIVRADLQLSLARALQAGGQYRRARTVLIEVAQRASEEGWPETLAEAAIALRPTGRPAVLPDPEALSALEAAREALSPRQHALRARVIGRLSYTPPYALDMGQRAKLSAEATELAQHAGDVDTQMDALVARLYALQGPDDIAATLEVSEQLLQLAVDHSRPQLQLEAHTFRYFSYLQLGEIASADRENQRALELSLQVRNVLWSWHCERAQALRAMCDGRLEDAELRLKELTPRGRKLQGKLALLYFQSAMYWLMRERGDLAAFKATQRDQVLERYGWSGQNLRAAVLTYELDMGRLEAARSGFEELAQEDFDSLLPTGDYVACLCNLATIAVAVGQQTPAEVLYERLSPYRRLNAVNSLGHYTGSASHYLAQLAVFLDRPKLAKDHFEAALEMNERMGARPALCRTRVSFGRFLQQRTVCTDTGRARELLQQAKDMAETIGMRGLAAEAAS